MDHDKAHTIAVNVRNILTKKQYTMNTYQITYFEIDRYGLILYPDFTEIETKGNTYDLSIICSDLCLTCHAVSNQAFF